MKLTNPTDGALDTAFAIEIAGWAMVMNSLGRPQPKGKDGRWIQDWNFTGSADLVLPWLEKHGWCGTSNRAGSTCMATVSVVIPDAQTEPYEVVAQQDWTQTQTPFPRAAVIALLRANGVEVELTP